MRFTWAEDASKTCTYQVYVTLKGHITLEDAAATGEAAAAEKPAKVFVLKLDAPITVMARPDEKANRITEREVTRIQFDGGVTELKDTLAAFEKSQVLVQVSGKLSHEPSPQHNTPVLMDAKRVIVAPADE
jgi:hypothetical protein